MDFLVGLAVGLGLGVFAGRRSAGAPSVPHTGRPLGDAERAALDRDVRAVLRDQGKIEAIKLWRERTGADLRAAKQAVEEIEGGGGR